MTDNERWFKAYCAAMGGFCADPAIMTDDMNGMASRVANDAVAEYKKRETTVEVPWQGDHRIELLGHRAYIGRVREVERFGSHMGEVQPLNPDDTYGESCFFGGKSVYSMSRVEHDDALAEVRAATDKWVQCAACGRAIAHAQWGDPLYHDEHPRCKACIAEGKMGPSCEDCEAHPECKDAECKADEKRPRFNEAMAF